MLDIMFYEVFEEEQRLLRRYLPEGIKAGYTSATIQESGTNTLPAGIISIRTQSIIPLDWADSLRGILSRSQGYDHLQAYRRRSRVDIPCGYLNDYCSRAVAEHAVMVMMALLRRLKAQINKFNAFDRDGITGCECMGKCALIIGVGRIGSVIAELAAALKMTVLGVDIVERVSSVEYVSLTHGIGRADVVFCALPLTPQTRGMLDYAVLSRVKKGAVFINISRGEIAPEAGLARLLSEGRLGGIGLDVYSEEGRLAACFRQKDVGALPESIRMIIDFAGKENVILTPHNAFNTAEAVERKAEESVRAVVYFLKHGKFPVVF